MDELTREQEALADHRHGPAVGFAVAGAGKTRTLVELVKRRVAAGVAPERLLLATFAKANVADLQSRLGADLAGVEVVTLHKLALQVVRAGSELGLVEHYKVFADPNGLLSGLGLRADEREDFLRYLALEKANLRVPDLSLRERFLTKLSVAAGKARQLELYRAFKAQRVANHQLTFDDMALQAYRLLVTHPSLRKLLSARFEHILVDEFQDVNRAQAELLDLLSGGGKNLVVIGDDDQTIYSWRGADPGYIQTFAKRYQATVYRLSDNFRSRGEVLALANALIEKNPLRTGKSLSLTQGYGGALSLGPVAAFVDELQRDLQTHSPENTAVLARLYRQFPGIEVQLIRAEVPYRVVGASPFYLQHACVALIQQLQAAYFERKPPRNAQERQRAAKCRAYLCERSLSDVENARVLERHLDRPAGELLRQLAGAVQTGRPEVAALISLAAGVSGVVFVEQLRALAGERCGRAEPARALTLTTAFKAKGLEWDCVYVPDVEEDVYPAPGSDLEEERRLFYVAVTRAREHLRLYARTEKASRFLAEGQPEQRATKALSAARLLERDPDGWSGLETLTLVQLVKAHHLERFLSLWHERSDDVALRVAGALKSLGRRARRAYGIGRSDVERWATAAPAARRRHSDAAEFKTLPKI